MMVRDGGRREDREKLEREGGRLEVGAKAKRRGWWCLREEF